MSEVTDNHIKALKKLYNLNLEFLEKNDKYMRPFSKQGIKCLAEIMHMSSDLIRLD